MKGVIAVCLSELVKEKFGREKWQEILEKSGLPKTSIFMPTGNLEDEVVLKVVETTCKVLNLTLIQAADAFGEYWMMKYAPKVYKAYFFGKTNARDFLTNMDKVHQIVTERIKDARPPRFDYEWQTDRILIMTYNSDRGLVDFFVGLLKGVGKYFNEKLGIFKMGGNKIKILFP